MEKVAQHVKVVDVDTHVIEPYDLWTSPLEIFKKHIYGTFWFESESVKSAVDYLGPDNIMFETDFPHPTSVAPRPNTFAKNPIEHIEHRFAISGFTDEVVEKILSGNAKRLYHLD